MHPAVAGMQGEHRFNPAQAHGAYLPTFPRVVRENNNFNSPYRPAAVSADIACFRASDGVVHDAILWMIRIQVRGIRKQKACRPLDSISACSVMTFTASSYFAIKGSRRHQLSSDRLRHAAGGSSQGHCVLLRARERFRVWIRRAPSRIAHHFSTRLCRVRTADRPQPSDGRVL